MKEKEEAIFTSFFSFGLACAFVVVVAVVGVVVAVVVAVVGVVVGSIFSFQLSSICVYVLCSPWHCFFPFFVSSPLPRLIEAQREWKNEWMPSVHFPTK